MMRQISSSALFLCTLMLVGCSSMFDSPDSSWAKKLSSWAVPEALKADRKTAAKTDDDSEKGTQFVGSRITISGMTAPFIEGVGLVTGLDRTGGDVPPSTYRRVILEDMKKRRIENPQALLKSPGTAVVVVRAYLPPLAKDGDKIDVEVILPPGSEATSLRGGWLLPTRMHEQGFVAGGRQIRDDEAAIATGPVLISTGQDDDFRNAGVVRKGMIPGGAQYIGDNRTLSLVLRSDYRSARTAKRIADNVGLRFHGFDEYGSREPLAEAKTDTRIELKLPEVYQDNFPRFLKVVRRVAINESRIETRVRIERLREDLFNPAKSEDAALQLEAIGRDAAVVLREGLDAEDLICRFQAAAALAYLGDAAGVEVLGEAAATNRALRVWSMLAMTSLSGGEAIPELVKLLDSESIETRYGAVRALSTIDEYHPAIEGYELTKRATLRLIGSSHSPVVHLTKSQLSEITLFGAHQEFRLPLTARAGNNILVVGNPGDRAVRVSRFAVGEPDETQTVSPRVADVIRAAAELGATYPDLVSLLLEAESQHNLPGEIAIDALPRGGRMYVGGAFAADPALAIEPDTGEAIGIDSPELEDADDPAAPKQTIDKPPEVGSAEGATASHEVAPSSAPVEVAPAISADQLSDLPPSQGEPSFVR